MPHALGGFHVCASVDFACLRHCCPEFRNADRPNRLRARSHPPMPKQQVKNAEPDCPFFGPDRERYFTDALRRKSGMPPVRRLSATTDAVGKDARLRSGRQPHLQLRSDACRRVDRFLHLCRLPGQRHHPGAQDHGLGVCPPHHAGPDGTHSDSGPRAQLRRRYGSRQARQADRGTAGQTGMDRQVDDVFRRPVPEHGPQAEHRPAAFPDRAQCVLRMDQGLAHQRQAIQPDGHGIDRRLQPTTRTTTAPPISWWDRWSPWAPRRTSWTR